MNNSKTWDNAVRIGFAVKFQNNSGIEYSRYTLAVLFKKMTQLFLFVDHKEEVDCKEAYLRRAQGCHQSTQRRLAGQDRERRSFIG